MGVGVRLGSGQRRGPNPPYPAEGTLRNEARHSGACHGAQTVARDALERDRDWYGALDALFQDHDILNLYDADHDGIEDPDSLENRAAGMGDYRPASWFTWFHNRTPRAPARHVRA